MRINHVSGDSAFRCVLTGLGLAAAAGLGLAACSSAGPARAGAHQATTAVFTEPALHTYVGQLDGAPGTKVALLIGRDSSEAYVCDNHQVAELLFGSAGQSSQQAGAVELTGADGARVGATFGAPVINGTATLPGQPPARFTAEAAHGDDGLYEASTVAKGALLQGRWIVEPNHEVAGAAKLNGTIVANPSLQHNVNLTAGTLQPVAVGIVGRTIRQLIPHLTGISTPAQWPNPTPKPSVPDSGAPLFLDGAGLVGNVQVTLIGPFPTGPIRGTSINGSAVFFDTPQLPVDGTYQVSVTTAGGTSNSLPLRVVHVR